MTDLRAIGIDPSLSSTGIATLDHIFTLTAGELRDGERLDFFYNHTLDLLREYMPHIVAIEGYAYAAHHSGQVSRAEAIGCMKLACQRSCVPVVVIPPTNRAKYATGKGNANKFAVVSAVASRTGTQFQNSDECDAWILWQMTLAHYQPEHPALIQMPKLNLDALRMVEWPKMDINTPQLQGVLANKRTAAARSALPDVTGDWNAK